MIMEDSISIKFPNNYFFNSDDAVGVQFTSTTFLYTDYSQARSSVPPKIPLMNLLFES